ncbi:Cell division protein FtsX [Desulfovibrio sp. DV]|uniref:ABC transporter permease n=1 Tax=Desulfovibrio sp. DV TaxID=1844708 RepID=UPI000959CCAB|nr:ABC transporter permease [Desulfovibrio sp. DV]OLN30833.1 Cell division protein FtsX [Desulfovibrio sp. DV]
MLFSLRIALKALATHKMRTVLAMLGVFLGAFALTGVLHISLAMEQKAVEETEKLGPNLLMAMTGNIRFRRGDIRPDAGNTNLKLPDAVALLRGLPSAVDGVPYLSFPMPIRSASKKIMCQVVATWPAYPSIRGNTPQYGRFFDQSEEDDKALVCALGPAIASRLFGTAEAAVGQSVFIYRARLQVVGVMEEKGSDISGANQDEQVFVPLSTYMRRMSNKNYIHGVYLRLADGADFDAAREAAASILRRRHEIKTDKGQADDFKVLTGKDTMNLKQQALDLVQTLGFISSSLSFGIGGLGILSIMILLVRSRRLEIGIRRAVGARRGDIIRQFLIESGLMATVGGAAGTAAALAVLLVVYRLGEFPSVFNPILIGGALAGSAVLGILAGAYPAWQAANVEVLSVLRDE